ncbi:MAG: hypothetical protein ACPGRF_07520, partial [Miltoncostaeaceae bacterium]
MGDNPGSDAKGERTRSRGGKRSGPASDRVGRAGFLINRRAQDEVVAVNERTVPASGVSESPEPPSGSARRADGGERGGVITRQHDRGAGAQVRDQPPFRGDVCR